MTIRHTSLNYKRQNSRKIASWLERNLALREGNFISREWQEFRIADGRLDHEKHLPIFATKTGLAGLNSRKTVVAVRKEFGMAESNFVMKNARSEVKEFETRM